MLLLLKCGCFFVFSGLLLSARSQAHLSCFYVPTITAAGTVAHRDINHVQKGKTALLLAVDLELLGIARLLLSYGASVSLLAPARVVD